MRNEATRGLPQSPNHEEQVAHVDGFALADGHFVDGAAPPGDDVLLPLHGFSHTEDVAGPLLVALLPEDAAQLPEEYERVTEI